ncbi:hypothetical protein [Bacillus sp. EB600]|uniref:hypothetical protein n=1 Tax=Bacillus sp. EB600 TaxID=2806345 RepID=UPI00210D9697|nr:hypothetical protein [Bacillus sp. EB600]MCQ6282149.1 hypothetical protein [Bacillus sp. EB600]
MVAYIDPYLMRIFRKKIANPATFRRVCGILCNCRFEDLCRPEGAYGLVDNLSSCLGVAVSPEQRDNAASWIMTCGIDPAERRERYRMLNHIREF